MLDRPNAVINSGGWVSLLALKAIKNRDGCLNKSLEEGTLS
jgi:hypothetical protein